MKRHVALIGLVVLLICASSAPAATRIVRTGGTYSTVQAAANAALDGDTIEIDSGTYTGDVGNALITRNNFTLRGVGATRPILDAGNTSIQGKAIWVIQGINTTVEFIEFQNCHVTDKNGAGIRQEGDNLTVRNCYFHDNEDGILTGASTSSAVLIETSEFYHNGAGDGQSHQIYIGNIAQLTVQYCYFHQGYKGQEIKTRANLNYVLYNRITCEDGYSNYEVSSCQGGTTYVIGNVIHQGPNTTNSTIVDHASEGALNPDNHLYVVNNTIVNTRGVGIFVRNASTVTALVQNNIFQGVGTPTSGPVTDVTNWVTSNAYLVDAANFDFHLTSSSTGAINVGTAAGYGINGFSLTPVSQYVHPRSYEARPVNGTIDIGSYEYAGSSGNPVDDVAVGETAVAGTVVGSYFDTQSSNNVYEAITEISSGGKRAYSYLERKWTFTVTGGSSVTFYLESYRPTNADGDNFVFAYSTNGTTWTNMVTVTKAADDNAYQTYLLPAGISGTVYVRVQDTNRTSGKIGLDTVYIDHMFFRSQP